MDELLRQRIGEYEQYLKHKGINDEIIGAYVMAAQVAYNDVGELEYAKKVSSRAKQLINLFCKQKTSQDIWTLIRYAQDHGQQYDLINQFNTILLCEAQNRNLDSYMIYLEHNRPYKEQFYLPRRKCFEKAGVVQGLQDMVDDKLDILSLSLPPGTGKGGIASSKVLTPDGWTTMGKIKVGDKVIAGNGNVATVVGVFPQGKRKCYRFTLQDGSQTTVSDNHLWEVQTRDDRRYGKEGRVIETSEMLKNFRLENGKRANYSIPYVPKIDFGEKPYYIAPYVMGALLGDGCLINGIGFTKKDRFIVDKMNGLMPDTEFVYKGKTDKDYYLRSKDQTRHIRQLKINKEINRLGLRGKRSYEKFIPAEYMLGSYEQRLELLRGLLDTDGSVSGSCIEYSTTSEQLAEDVKELALSLSAYCQVTKRQSGYRNKNKQYIRCHDSYRLVIEFQADHENPFSLPRKAEKYNPKRTIWKRYIENIEYVGEEECTCIYISDPCHLYITDDYIVTHNTTIEKFFHSAICGWDSEKYNLFFSHSADITRMYYDGVLSIMQDPDYCWSEIFPKKQITATNAKLGTINIGSYKPFQNVMTASVGSEMAGKVRANGYLLVDDMIGKIEEALNKNMLDKLWNIYSTDARQRKVEGCKEIHIATRWSVHDVIGRLQRVYEGNPRCRFIAVPDIDPATGESNFMFDVHPFTTDFFHDQERLMDDVTYRCLYKNDPIEREGLLYHDEEIMRYLELPGREPDAIVGVCDSKTSGIDFMVLPVMYRYDDDYYMVDCICDDNTDFGIQESRLANMITDYNMQQCEFESNAGGSRLALNVADKVKKLGGRCNITTKPTETNKETRIIVNADWVKKHVYFKDKTMYTPKSDYGTFMNFLLSYTIMGRNPHDDVPDCLANFALHETKVTRRATFEPIMNPFRGGWR